MRASLPEQQERTAAAGHWIAPPRAGAPILSELPSPLAPLTCLLRNGHLAWQLSKREIQGRYRGSLLGLAWVFANPLILLAIFTFVFGFVYRARWSASPSAPPAEFSLILFTGLVVFWIFSDCVSRSCSLIRGNPSYVKKIVFPVEILPWTVMAGALFHAAVSLLVLLAFYPAVFGAPPWTAFLLPVVVAPFLLLTMGLCWLIASIGVFLRDVDQLVSTGLLAVLFLSTVFYSPSALPESFAPLLYLNPVSWVVDQVRATLIFGVVPGLWGLCGYFVAGWGIAWLGFFWFQRSRKGFADVL